MKLRPGGGAGVQLAAVQLAEGGGALGEALGAQKRGDGGGGGYHPECIIWGGVHISGIYKSHTSHGGGGLSSGAVYKSVVS